MDNTDRTQSIKEVVEGIDAGKLFLPEFQRDFVWEEGKTYDLFDSLVRDIFIGSIIYGVPSFEITVREMDNRPRRGEGSRAKLSLRTFTKDQIEKAVQTTGFQVVLDGQQRLTSIFRALKGVDPVWFIADNGVLSQSRDQYRGLSLEMLLYEFAGREDEERLSIRISDIYKMLDGSITRESDKIQLLKQTAFGKSRHEGTPEFDDLVECFLTSCDKLVDLLKREKLLSYYLLNTDTEKFALFFERSNSKGNPLNFIDILAAKLYSGFNLRKHIDQFEEANPKYELNRDLIVRAIAYEVSDGKDIDRSFILENLNASHFTHNWGRICSLYKKCLDFLYVNSFIISQSWMPYETMLIPLMVFLDSLGGEFSEMEDYQTRFLKYWWWSSVFSQRYTGSSNEVIIRDARVLTRIAKKLKLTDPTYFQRLRILVTSPEDLRGYNKKGSVLYLGVLNLLNYASSGLLDWRNGTKLDFNAKLDDHHIFPKAYLNKVYKGEEDPLQVERLMDSVINRALIPKLMNFRIGSNKPSIYLAELKESNANLEFALRSHFYPP